MALLSQKKNYSLKEAEKNPIGTEKVESKA